MANYRELCEVYKQGVLRYASHRRECLLLLRALRDRLRLQLEAPDFVSLDFEEAPNRPLIARQQGFYIARLRLVVDTNELDKYDGTWEFVTIKPLNYTIELSITRREGTFFLAVLPEGPKYEIAAEEELAAVCTQLSERALEAIAADFDRWLQSHAARERVGFFADYD